MSLWVIDASVAVKWLLPEVHSESALRLLSSESELHAPDLLYAEVGNALWKHVRLGELARSEALTALNLLDKAPLEIHATKELAPFALELVFHSQKTLYDTLYLALAVVKDCPVVTADKAFYKQLQSGPFEKHVAWIGALE